MSPTYILALIVPPLVSVLMAWGVVRIGRFASAQLGKVSEDGPDESTYGDRPAVPSALILNAGDDLAGVPGARLMTSFHKPLASVEAQQDHA